MHGAYSSLDRGPHHLLLLRYLQALVNPGIDVGHDRFLADVVEQVVIVPFVKFLRSFFISLFSSFYVATSLDQPNVNAYASAPESRNAISNCRSAMDPGCRIN